VPSIDLNVSSSIHFIARSWEEARAKLWGRCEPVQCQGIERALRADSGPTSHLFRGAVLGAYP
jgi:hypothetical protein